MVSALSPLIAVAGPTGSGKSDLAIFLADRFRGVIVNYDSVQVYRGFDVGSAKVPVSGRKGVRHVLVDLRHPGELFTAGDFVAEATLAITEITRAGDLPILAGGTGFYLRALLQGVSEVPTRDEEHRRDLARRESRRPGAMYRLLRRLDPDASARIHPRDSNKVLRALEIRLLAGRPSSRLFSQNPPKPLQGYRTLILGINPPRSELYRRLDERCDRIWRGGLLDEVRELLNRGVSRYSKPFESLGYKQALEFLVDGKPEAEALVEMKVRTRQYAKRQWTWFRNEPGIYWLDGFGDSPEVWSQASQRITLFLSGEA
jgi:tRNA dimethylallyltransferase